jgi:ribonuclease P/MRP protein subunit POP1
MARDSTLKPSYLHQHTRTPAHAPAHVKRAALAASLLAPVPTPLPKPGEAEYPHVPDEEDLIGFVTTGNFNLGEGRGTGVGCVAVEKVKAEIERGGWCIVRESGCTVGRVGRWVAV